MNLAQLSDLVRVMQAAQVANSLAIAALLHVNPGVKTALLQNLSATQDLALSQSLTDRQIETLGAYLRQLCGAPPT